MHPFEYAAPETLDQALGLLGEHGDEAKVLAGGQSLIPILHYRLARPRVVIDINGLLLGDIVVENGRLGVGALVRYHQLEESDVIARRCPVLGEAARLIGNVRVRTLGTVGGSLAHADPAAELPAVMTALDARLAMAGPSGRRTLGARDFFTGQALVRSSVLNSYRRLGGHCTNQLQIIGLERGEGIEPISIQRSVYSCFRNQGRANRGTNALGND